MAKSAFFDDFSDSTQQKLLIYGNYLTTALPVFLLSPFVESITIYDFFAGPGETETGQAGSPKVAMKAVCDVLRMVPQTKPVRILLNEKDDDRYRSLNAWAHALPAAQGVSVETSNEPFSKAFQARLPEMRRDGQANLILIDQFGVDQVTAEVFRQLALLRLTDFLFFLASSFAYRFRERLLKLLPELKKEEQAQMNAENAHSFFAEAYRRILPQGCGCLIGRYTLKHGSNYYGLVFGSHSPKGIEKFLDTVWNLSPEYGGRANYDWAGQGIRPGQPLLFDIPEMSIPKNILDFRSHVENLLENGIVPTDASLYIDGLWYGLRGRDTRAAIGLLAKEGKIPPQKLLISFDRWRKIRNGKCPPTPLARK